MRDGLRSIDEGEGSLRLGGDDHLFHRVDGAEGVGDVADGEEIGALGEEGVEGLQIEGAVVEDGNDFELGTAAFAKHLPGDDVGVVLEVGDEDFVTGCEVSGESEDGGDEIDAVGGAGGEDDLVRRWGVEVSGDRDAGFLVGSGGGLGEMVGAAVDVGVDLLVVASAGVENGRRVL